MLTATLALMPGWLDPDRLISAFGPYALAGVALVIFAECGLLVGFFLPGDTLLFTTGLLVAAGVLDTPLWLVWLVLVVAACVGNLVGYGIGRRAGPAVFERRESGLFSREQVARTHAFFETWGPWAIGLARFVPVVRTFITVVAGVGRMDFRLYAVSTAVGGSVWVVGVTVAGYYLGRVAFIRDHVETMLMAAVLLSVLSVGVELFRGWLRRRRGGSGRHSAQPRRSEDRTRV